MTPKERAAMQQALEALEEAYAAQFETTWFEIKPEHFTALREVLAEPDIEEMTLTQIAARHEQAEQEPVAWSQERKRNLIKHWALDCGWDDLTEREIDDLELIINAVLNAAPVRTKDLTDEEIMDLVRDECVDMRWPSTPLFIARAVIAAYREKNK